MLLFSFLRINWFKIHIYSIIDNLPLSDEHMDGSGTVQVFVQSARLLTYEHLPLSLKVF